jgi:hypothetical protein
VGQAISTLIRTHDVARGVNPMLLKSTRWRANAKLSSKQSPYQRCEPLATKLSTSTHPRWRYASFAPTLVRPILPGVSL